MRKQVNVMIFATTLRIATFTLPVIMADWDLFMVGQTHDTVSIRCDATCAFQAFYSFG
jgi:hypothetical protein